MSHIWRLILGYILAAPLTTLVSLNLMETEWTHILTYVWIAASFLAWKLIFFAAAFVIAAISNR